jgi:hypothetical protein
LGWQPCVHWAFVIDTAAGGFYFMVNWDGCQIDFLPASTPLGIDETIYRVPRPGIPHPKDFRPAPSSDLAWE